MSAQPESSQNAQQGYPSLCKNGCGFFSSVDAKGFCSVCYKDFLKKDQATEDATTTEEVADTTASMSNLNVSVEEPLAEASAVDSSEKAEAAQDGAVAKPELQASAAAAPAATAEEADEDAKEPKKVKKNRCASCKKKVGLTGFSCR